VKDKRKFIRLARKNRCLLGIKLTEVPKRYNARNGEVDIIIGAAKRKYFDVACIQTEIGRLYCKDPVNNISWQ
jgi:hypothetical protein